MSHSLCPLLPTTHNTLLHPVGLLLPLPRNTIVGQEHHPPQLLHQEGIITPHLLCLTLLILHLY